MNTFLKVIQQVKSKGFNFKLVILSLLDVYCFYVYLL